jgi:hypothetical protein
MLVDLSIVDRSIVDRSIQADVDWLPHRRGRRGYPVQIEEGFVLRWQDGSYESGVQRVATNSAVRQAAVAYFGHFDRQERSRPVSAASVTKNKQIVKQG